MNLITPYILAADMYCEPCQGLFISCMLIKPDFHQLETFNNPVNAACI